MQPYQSSPPSSDLNKPLPSPPIAQVVDLDSPPKARRTLLDAVYDTPTKILWPAIRPVNQLSASAIGTLQQRSVSVGGQQVGPSTVDVYSSFAATTSHREDIEQVQEHRRLSSNSPDGKNPYTFVNKANVDVERFTSRSEKSAPVIPPRHSSNRHSLLPLSPTNVDTPTYCDSSRTRELASAATIWPKLGDIATSANHDGVLVKRQSWRSSTSSSGVGSGPVLTISDADTIIMGRKSLVSKVPPVPHVLPERSLPQRSISSPASRTLSRNFSRPSPIRVESGPDGRQGVLISPIRSMKPTRQTSSSSPLQTNKLKAGELPLVATPVDKREHHDDAITIDAVTTTSTASRVQHGSVQDESTTPTANYKAEAAERPIKVDTVCDSRRLIL